MYETGYSMLYKTKDDRANRRLAIVTIGITSTEYWYTQGTSTKGSVYGILRRPTFLDHTSTQYSTCSVQYILQVPPLMEKFTYRLKFEFTMNGDESELQNTDQMK